MTVNVWHGKTSMFLQKGINIILLNLLWFICSIPIITLGPSTAAMTGVIRNWHLNQDESVIRSYIIQFRKHLRQGIFVVNFWIAIGVLLLFDAYIFLQVTTSLKVFLLAITCIAIILYLMTSAYLFPILVHYELSGMSIIKRAFTYSFLDGRTTFANILMWIGAGMMIFYAPVTFFIVPVPVTMITFRFSLHAFGKIEKLAKITGKAFIENRNIS
jgi:uncharacterized membrane protein YesL